MRVEFRSRCFGRFSSFNIKEKNHTAYFMFATHYSACDAAHGRWIQEGRYQTTLDECLIHESRLTSIATSCQISSDFCQVYQQSIGAVCNLYSPKCNIFDTSLG